MAENAKTKANLPKLDLLGKIKDFQAKQERGKETAPEIRDWTRNAIFNLQETRKALREIPKEEKTSLIEVILKEATISAILEVLWRQKPLAQIQDMLHKRLSGGEEAETKENFTEIMESVKRTMEELCSPLPFEDSNDLAPNMVKAAWLGYYDFLLSYDVSSLTSLKAFLVKLEKDGYLIQSPEGTIKFDGLTLGFPPESLFGKAEKDEAGQMFRNLIRQVLEREEEELFKRSEITLQELWQGKKGLIALNIPDEILTENSKIFRRAGGPLLLFHDGEKIRPVQGLGGIRQKAQEIKQITVGDNQPLYLLRNSLSFDSPPPLNGIPEDAAKALRQLWHWVKRFLLRDELLEEYGEKSTVTLEKWCLNKKSGVALAVFSKSLKTKDWEGTFRTVFNPFLLIERKMEEKVAKIQVIAVPDHLQGIFGPLLNKKYIEGREPEVLRSFLRAVSSEVANNANAAKKANQISKTK